MDREAREVVSTRADGTEPPEAREVLSECADLLDTEYERAKTKHLLNESKTGERDVTILANFRDAFDHTTKLITALDENEPEKAREQLPKVEEHLERVIYDGSKGPVESDIEYLERHRLPAILYRLTLRDAPSNRTYSRNMREIRDLYFEGRDQRSPQRFEDAKRKTEQLRERTPPRGEIYTRLLVIYGGITSILGVISAIFL